MSDQEEDKQALDRAATMMESDDAEKKRQAEIDALGESIIEALRTIYDPEIPVNIFDLGLVYSIVLNDEGEADIHMTLTAPGCPVAGEMPGWVQDAVEAVPGIKSAAVALVWDPPWGMDMLSDEARLELGFM